MQILTFSASEKQRRRHRAILEGSSTKIPLIQYHQTLIGVEDTIPAQIKRHWGDIRITAG